MTERSKPDRELFESERAFRILVQGVTDYAIYMLDHTGIVSSWNTGAARIKGYEASEVIGRHFSIFYPPEDQAAGLPERALAAARATGRFEAEGWRLRKDGTRFFASVVIDAIVEEGQFIGFAKITRDITERLKARSALAESENHFRLLVGNITDYALYMLDPQGFITNWNLGGQRIKGYVPDEIVGQHFGRFYTPADQKAGKPARALQIARETGRYEEEGFRVRKDGSFFWASVIIDPIRNDSGELIGFAKITRDITERREAQQKLERVQAELAESRKMDALGQLTGGVAHDFNNLLMGLAGGLHRIKRSSTDPAILKTISAMEGSIKRGAGLTRQLLTFARRQQVHPVRLDLAKTVFSMQEVLRAGLRGNVALTLDIAPDVWRVHTDPGELETALVNLVINARDALLEGGDVRISASNHQAGASDSTDYVRIAVKDNGVGIPPDVLEKVFDPFFTTKPVGQGTGLGLSQVHGFANQAGGRVEVESQLGEGTEVSIWLPRARDEEIEDPVEATDKTVGTVLMVEDNPDVASAGAMLLEELGYRVKWAPDAETALSEVENDGIDIVFSDIVMPGRMDGLGLARRLKRKYPSLPIILTTGYSDAVLRTDVEFPMVRKPYELHELSLAFDRINIR
ncbi:hybrid sensor histidine kinase/response regulator [Rhodopseudomonas telluris]|uniref:histidine kinase n=1 Tax=Rhodopseudomonas telluris TaxID=644215 RepID=A0ABV6F105_9BRAD